MRFRFPAALFLLLVTGGYGLFPGSAQAQATPPGNETSVEIRTNGHGWDVVVSWHIRVVDIPEARYTGSYREYVGRYPRPYIESYSFFIDNGRCGGTRDPVTGQYQYPTRGRATITTAFPVGTREVEWVGYITGTTDDCSEDGGARLELRPVITPGDYRAIVGSIWARVALPELSLRVNPGRGLVTVPGWFWLELTATGEWWPGTDPAEDGQPFGVVVTIPLPGQLQRVAVLAEAEWLYWNFGDGSPAGTLKTGQAGKAYPQKSGVRYRYNTATSFFPAVTLHYVPRYSWNGGNWTVLPELYRESYWQKTEGYRVIEAQTVLIAPLEEQPETERR